jgi:hypothetical protein
MTFDRYWGVSTIKDNILSLVYNSLIYRRTDFPRWEERAVILRRAIRRLLGTAASTFPVASAKAATAIIVFIVFILPIGFSSR